MVAVITGAGSGIGQALSVEICRKKDAKELALADVKRKGLDETKSLCEKILPDVKIELYEVDVANRDSVEEFARNVQNDFESPVNILINNAGTVHGGIFEQVQIESFDRVMNVNFNGVVNCTKAFLPLLLDASNRQKQKPHIVNISSMYGFFGTPEHTSYHASKYAVRGFNESLCLELAGRVKVHSVHPGFIKTKLVKHGTADKDIEVREKFFDFITSMTPATAAKLIMKGVRGGRFRILLTPEAYIFDFIARIFPSVYAYPWLHQFCLNLTIAISLVASKVRDYSLGLLGDVTATLLTLLVSISIVNKAMKRIIGN